MDTEDRVLSAALRARIAVAKAVLKERMATSGLTEATGWTIVEELRPAAFGTELVFRPMHMKQEPPEYDVRVAISSEGVPL